LSIRWKTIILVASTVVIILVALFVAAQFILLPGFQKVDEKDAGEAVERVTGALFNRINNIHTLNHDWAAWDDTYNFVLYPDENQDYITSNLTETTFANAQLNFILIIDNSGNLVAGKAFDLINNTETTIPKNLEAYIFTDNLLSHQDINDSHKGILPLSTGSLLISAQPILTSMGEGPVAGTLIMAEYLDTRLIDSISSSINLPVEIISLSNPNLSFEYKDIFSSFSPDTSIVTAALDRQSIAAYTLVNDINGNPAYIVRTYIDRDVFVNGTAATRYLLIAMLISMLLLGILLYFFIGKFVISKLGRIGEFVSNISSSGDLSRRLPATSNDEMGQLSKNINNMVEALKRSQQSLETKQQEATTANNSLTVMVKKLELKESQNNILSEMRALLQSCSTIEETPPIIMNYMNKLFPAAGGALFLMSASRSDLDSVAKWGDFPDDIVDNVFAPDECWGLRRGSVYLVEDIKTKTICPHLKNNHPVSYVCLPLVAKGDVLGLLHLRLGETVQPEEIEPTIANWKEMANIIAENLSLSIANINLSESLAKQSIRDSLTGLFNKRYMEEFLQREILRANRKHTPIGIIMADIDHFKNFNDTYGHLAGDKLLRQLGELFTRRIRGTDIACRYGGEEFAIFLPESSREDTFRRAEQLRLEISNMEIFYREELLGNITISMGVSIYPEDGTNTEDLLRKADACLYRAKSEGRNKVVIA